MDNIFKSKNPKDFYVWVDPNDFLAEHNLKKIGSFFSMPPNPKSDNLMFLPNTQFSGFISPFQAGLLWKYSAEYNLELSRRANFSNYPSRLTAVFLLETEIEAKRYFERNYTHVGKRVLMHVRTVGEYEYSIHDSSWVDFLGTKSGKDPNTIRSVCDSYWKGITVEQCNLTNMGQPWTESPIFEILLLGRVDLVRE